MAGSSDTAISSLRNLVYEANMAIPVQGLAVLTWGNVSGYDADLGLMAIKPSGVSYSGLKPADIVVMNLAGDVLAEEDASPLRPSSDTPTHLELYRAFPGVRAIVHTHSPYAAGWAQALMPIPVLGTTHADQTTEAIPCTPPLEEVYIQGDYETETGRQIIRHLQNLSLDARDMEMILVGHHGPFAWGSSVQKALDNAVALEEIAKMAYITKSIRPDSPELPESLKRKHYLRKHGPEAYYGQEKPAG